MWCEDSRTGKHLRTVFLFENTILLTKLRQQPSAVSSSSSTSSTTAMTSATSTTSHLVSTVLASVLSSSSLSAVAVAASAGDVHSKEECDSSSNLSGGVSDLDTASLPPGLSLPPLDAQPTGPTYEIKMELSVSWLTP